MEAEEIAVLPAQPLARENTLGEKVDDDEITPAIDEKGIREAVTHTETADITPEMRRKIVEYYGRKAEEDDIAPASDVTVILEKILEMDEEQAMDICANAITYHASDPNFPDTTMAQLKRLVLGYKGADMDPADWSFELRTEACMLYWHSVSSYRTVEGLPADWIIIALPRSAVCNRSLRRPHGPHRDSQGIHTRDEFHGRRYSTQHVLQSPSALDLHRS